MDHYIHVSDAVQIPIVIVEHEMHVELLFFVVLPLIFLSLTFVKLGRAPIDHALKPSIWLAVETVAVVLWGIRIEVVYPDRHFFMQALVAFIPLFWGGLIEVGVAMKKREESLFPEVPMPVFQDTAAAGRGCESRLLRLWRSRHLVVTVTEKELWIRPVRRTALISRLWGLVHRVALLHIHQLERLTEGGANIRLEYGAEDGWCRCVELELKNPSAFFEAVREGQIEEAV